MTIKMPKELTAENGAKSILNGEFKVSFDVDCPECDGDGGYLDNDELEPCEMCHFSGSITLNKVIDWTQIKDIYSRIVKAVDEGRITLD